MLTQGPSRPPRVDQFRDHPYDTPVAAGLRFVVELTVWVAGPWAATQAIALWAAVPAAIILIAVPEIFTTPGDRLRILVATPGPLRVLIELLVYAVAVAAPWYVWPNQVAVAIMMLIASAFISGIPRILWLARGAPGGLPRQ